MTGKVALVTGANSSASIGYHMAFHMAFKGATVYVGARSAAKAEAGIKQMIADGVKEGKVKPFVAELSDLKAVKAAAEELAKSTDRLDVLINNAVT